MKTYQLLFLSLLIQTPYVFATNNEFKGLWKLSATIKEHSDFRCPLSIKINSDSRSFAVLNFDFPSSDSGYLDHTLKLGKARQASSMSRSVFYSYKTKVGLNTLFYQEKNYGSTSILGVPTGPIYYRQKTLKIKSNGQLNFIDRSGSKSKLTKNLDCLFKK